MSFPGASPDRHLVRLTEDHEEFATRAAALLDADPISTNVLATILAGVRAGRPQPPGSFWVLVEDDAGHPVGAAVRTAGLPVFLAAMPGGAAALISASLHREGHDVLAVRGDAAAARAFAAHWSARTGCAAERTATEGVHVLGTLVPPAGVPGGARPASPDDAPLVMAWFTAFDLETHSGESPPAAHAAGERGRLFTRRLAAGQVLLWMDGGEPVSLAGWQVPDGPAGQAIGRVGPVYTPPGHRQHGYAAAVTWTATQAVLDAGARGVMLYTDLANPTSTGIYARLGYLKIGDAAIWSFRGRPPVSGSA